VVLQLEPIDHALADALRGEDLELRVVEVGVLPIAAGPDAGRGLVDAQERRNGRFDLQERRRAVLGDLKERDQDPEAQADHGAGGHQQALAPEELEVVTNVEVALRGRAFLGQQGLRGHGFR
jgi:hypothetical protein